MTAPRPPEHSPDRRHWAALSLVLLLAAALRLSGLGSVGFWYDECITAYRATLGTGELLAILRPIGQAPLFILLEKLVHHTLGNEEWKLLLLPALFGTASVALGYHLGRKWIGPRAGLATAFLLAVSPLHLHYSREARSYSLLALLLMLSLWCVDRVVRQPRPRSVALAALAFSAVAYTHGVGAVYLAPLVAIAMLQVALRRRWRSLVGLAAAVALAVVTFLPWLPDYAHQVATIDEPYYWAQWHWDEVFPWQVPYSLAALSHGSGPPVTNMVTSTPWTAWLAAGLSTLLALVGLLRRAVWRRPEMTPLLLAGGVLSLLLLFAGAWLKAPVYVVGRTDSAALPFLVLLAASGIQALPRRLAWAPPLLLGALAVQPLVAELQSPEKSRDRRMNGIMAEVMEDGDMLLTSGQVFEPSAYYLGQWGREADIRVWPTTSSPRDSRGLQAEALLIATEARRRSRPVWWLVWSEYELDLLSPALYAHFDVVGRRDMYHRKQFLQLRARPSGGAG